MREIRLFIDAPLHPELELSLPDDAARHALRVLRLAAGDRVTLFNGDGRQYAAQLVVASGREARVRIDAVESPCRESPLQLTLVQALARGDKMDWIVQKATELGAVRIVPVVSARSEVRLDPTRAGKRSEHWHAVAIAACQQCGRNRLPDIPAPTTLRAFLDADGGDARSARWVLHPGAPTRLRDPVATVSAATLAVGPEGGFDDDDLAALHAAGYRGISLGPRTLRTETAGIAALAALQALHGDL